LRKLILLIQANLLLLLVIFIVKFALGVNDLKPLIVQSTDGAEIDLSEEAITDFLEAINSVDTSKADALRKMGTVYDKALSEGAAEKKSTWDRITEELEIVLESWLRVDSYIDLCLVAAILSLACYLVFILVNGLFRSITRREKGMPVINFFIAHPFILLITIFMSIYIKIILI